MNAGTCKFHDAHSLRINPFCSRFMNEAFHVCVCIWISGWPLYLMSVLHSCGVGQLHICAATAVHSWITCCYFWFEFELSNLCMQLLCCLWDMSPDRSVLIHLTDCIHVCLTKSSRTIGVFWLHCNLCAHSHVCEHQDKLTDTCQNSGVCFQNENGPSLRECSSEKGEKRRRKKIPNIKECCLFFNQLKISLLKLA